MYKYIGVIELSPGPRACLLPSELDLKFHRDLCLSRDQNVQSNSKGNHFGVKFQIIITLDI